ncbi:hypothetical protein X756_03330 [Mesorhizobium sp. LSHC412B00]|nr:hypothetical protein X756_03330 [Mesorhizobium sp. LSHC412B00]
MSNSFVAISDNSLDTPMERWTQAFMTAPYLRFENMDRHAASRGLCSMV